MSCFRYLICFNVVSRKTVNKKSLRTTALITPLTLCMKMVRKSDFSLCLASFLWSSLKMKSNFMWGSYHIKAERMVKIKWMLKKINRILTRKMLLADCALLPFSTQLDRTKFRAFNQENNQNWNFSFCCKNKREDIDKYDLGMFVE